ncbi:MAG: helix-turn-helix domain-containing protein [Rubellimicrobium sp.]|nr:helix-turn-helix domain-containing protein [Rubellimicrobium sp.]
MQELKTPKDGRDMSRALLGGWISRADLARELEVTEGTLRRWASERSGPPYIRAGRKVFYRRSAVVEWLEDQEAAELRRARRGARR